MALVVSYEDRGQEEDGVGLKGNGYVDWVGRGARSRLTDPFGGDKLDFERNSQVRPGLDLQNGLRFCETCRQKKPRGTRPAKKGWKCDDCRVGNKRQSDI
ncbi:hypothetical protein [Azotobacter beijerinckii]|uniref:hypothetical protein n=1 Tax=Azotobacter beijerinckii TaxID=170623 RepID=UPI0011133B85|nr:hypothetical protein [Azotobacter beijerinckii]